MKYVAMEPRPQTYSGLPKLKLEGPYDAELQDTTSTHHTWTKTDHLLSEPQ